LTFQLGPAPQRVAVDAEQVRRLIAGQFPQWAGLPVRPVADGGWDNWTFHLGSEMSVRLPAAAEYAPRRGPAGVPGRLGVDDATWARGRGWALWKTLSTCAQDPHDADAHHALTEILGDAPPGTALSGGTAPPRPVR
jgi:aminoglycoside phosphotransferase (APT) family kinase protein